TNVIKKRNRTGGSKKPHGSSSSKPGEPKPESASQAQQQRFPASGNIRPASHIAHRPIQQHPGQQQAHAPFHLARQASDTATAAQSGRS
ncbi:hypothetical protein H4R23_004316, partial [Coemansia sp. Cherry 401B]